MLYFHSTNELLEFNIIGGTMTTAISYGKILQIWGFLPNELFVLMLEKAGLESKTGDLIFERVINADNFICRHSVMRMSIFEPGQRDN